MPIYKKLSLIFILLYLLLVSLFPTSSYAYTQLLFEDSFDTPIPEKWIVANNPCTDDWEFKNGKYGMILNDKCLSSETTPSDGYWNEKWNDYTINLDMQIVSGYDKNLAWRFLDPDQWPNQWAGIHIQGTTPSFQRVKLINQNIFPITNLGTYHFTIESYGTYQKVSYFNILNPTKIGYLLGETVNPLRLMGRPALQVSNGTGVTTEVWFDNYIVTKQIDEIDVPYFSQKDSKWELQDYGYSGVDIGYYGCSLTSSAMLLRYHGINTIPGTSDDITPLTLNSWLLNNNGYDFESNLIFPQLAALASQYISLNPDSFASSSMELKRVDSPLEELYDFTNESIIDQENPVIIKKNSPNSPSNTHFIVGRGVINENEKYLIHDPLDENIKISDIPPDQYYSVMSLIPSNSDLSYLVLHTDEAVNFTIQDPNDIENESIERSVYGLIYPFASYLEPDGPSMPTTREFEQKYPLSGVHTILLNVDEDGFYNVWLLSMDKNGNDYLYNESIFLKANSPSQLILDNDHDDSSKTSVEFKPGYGFGCGEMSGIIDHLYQNGHIKHKGIHKALKYYAKGCYWKQKRYAKFSHIIKRYVSKRIEKLHPKYIDDTGKEYLLKMMKD